MSTRARQVRGGGRAVEVQPERLAGWFERFAERNDGATGTRYTSAEVVVTAGNGATATVAVPFPPLAADGALAGLDVGPLVAHAATPRRIGLLLVRLGGHSVGIAEHGNVVLSRTDRHLVHGRSAAGGWSQQRFARRRAGQARQALRAAADDAAEVLLPRLSELDGVVLGGDRRALDDLGADTRLAPLFALATPRVLDIAEPRRSVLDEAAERARAVEIVVRDREQ
ncbi:acVLRF1 family peptidyl-tRNA hydrolase [Saccharomonospora sp. NPDC046836]|uniref:acVLRF1 family peptidyl-tRNA hydrolase n=1 Tax=Saccharomonospora sp. NPDC046836 TaxID=3156921 RepID=UPI0033FAFE6D